MKQQPNNSLANDIEAIYKMKKTHAANSHEASLKSEQNVIKQDSYTGNFSQIKFTLNLSSCISQVNFMYYVIFFHRTWPDMSTHVKSVTQKSFKYIKSNNIFIFQIQIK